jgi:riboflavin synthase
MFTGIIETTGRIKEIMPQGGNLIFTIQSPVSNELKIDESVSHNGVCLTVVKVEEDTHQVIAINETLLKSNLNKLKTGDIINLERAMLLTSRLDGHIVQGHIDTIGVCVSIQQTEGSNLFQFSFQEKFAPFIIEKGSITVDGISLTAFDITNNTFTVAIIPYTFTNTNIQYKKTGDPVNLEFDIIGKYINRLADIKKN